MQVLLDTNILVRTLHAAAPEHPMVKSSLERLVHQGADLYVVNQDFFELWVVATRPVSSNGLGLSPGDAGAYLEKVRQAYAFLPDPSDLLDRWLDLCTRHSVSGRAAHDARIVAVMLAHGVTHLLTLNTGDFLRYPEIVCLHPAAV